MGHGADEGIVGQEHADSLHHTLDVDFCPWIKKGKASGTFVGEDVGLCGLGGEVADVTDSADQCAAVFGEGFLKGIACAEGVCQAWLDEYPYGVNFLPWGKEGGPYGFQVLD